MILNLRRKNEKKTPSQNCPFSSRNYWYGTLYFESKRPTSFPFLFCIWCACTWLDPLACKRYIAAFFVCISHSAIDLSRWLKNMLFFILIHLRIQEACSSLSLSYTMKCNLPPWFHKLGHLISGNMTWPPTTQIKTTTTINWWILRKSSLVWFTQDQWASIDKHGQIVHRISHVIQSADIILHGNKKMKRVASQPVNNCPR